MSEVENSLLGKDTLYDSPYNPALLFPIERKNNRASLAMDASEYLPFVGEDCWTCFELSWLEPGGKPRAGIAHFRIPCTSPNMIESKSFKLYLNSLNHHCFESLEALNKTLKTDLSAVAGANIDIEVVDLSSVNFGLMGAAVNAVCIDDIKANDFEYRPNPYLLVCEDQGSHDGVVQKGIVEERLYSDLLRSNCPVTGQPDWGSVIIDYRGKKIDRESLLRYIVSFRQCQDFHEHCVERMFLDILAQCECESLSVYARYTRRGGLDINPYRATKNLSAVAPNLRMVRQ